MTLRVILQVVPYGDEDKTYEIGRLDIFNKGPTGFGADTYTYGVINLTKDDAGLYTDEVWHTRSEGAWTLVYEVLENLGIEGP